MADASEGPGAALQAAREAHQLSVPEVADRLKLSSTVVAALETNDWSRLPPPVFVRGYVRAYARLTALDAEELLAGEWSNPGDEAESDLSAAQTLKRRRGLAWSIAGAVAAVAAAIGGALSALSDR